MNNMVKKHRNKGVKVESEQVSAAKFQNHGQKLSQKIDVG